MSIIKFNPCEDCLVRMENCSSEWCKAKEEYEKDRKIANQEGGILKCLGVDYSKDYGTLGLSIAELKYDKIKIIESLVLEPKNKQQAKDMCEYYFKKYNCQKVFSYDL